MDLSVVIVSYNVRYFLEQTLVSVQRAAAGLAVEVWVVDNHSQDGSADLVRARFPEVRLIANADNPGFSTANNQAIRRSTGRYVLLLNPDTVVGEDTFRRCLAFMDAHPRAGALGVRMIDGSGAFLPESKRGFPDPATAFYKTFGLAALFPRSRRFGRYHLGFLSPDETHEIDVLSGAFMWLRRSTLDEIGLLDETFFMYGEDIDLSYRVQLGGYQNYYLADTTIVHYKGESTKRGSLNYVRVFYQAMIIFAKKHFRGERARLFVGMLQGAIYFRAALTLGRNVVRRLALPLAEGALMAGGLVLLKNFWADNYFQNPDYYQPSFLRVNVPLYVGIWLGSIYFSGGYDTPYHARRLLRGLLVGTLLLAAIYGLLPLELRSSRTLLVLGAVWAMVGTFALRSTLHGLRFGSFRLGRGDARNAALVGSAAESERVRTLLDRAGSRANVVGTLLPAPPADRDRFLGTLDELDALRTLYGLNEFIFCSQDVPYATTIEWMRRLGPRHLFRTVPPGGTTIIGSHSKHARGQLYTVAVNFNLEDPTVRRGKRLFDLAVAVLGVAVLPVWMFVGGGRAFFKNWVAVLLGRRTWVGYAPVVSERSLPPLPAAVWSLGGGLTTSPAVLRRLNFLYAKDYRTGSDWAVLRRRLFGGGRA